MRISSVALLVALTTAVLGGQSQPPSPSGSVGSQAPQNQSSTQNSSPNGNQSPIVAPIGKPPTAEPTKAGNQGDKQPSANWWDWFTANGANWAIVFLTIVLAVLGGFQWWATHTANKHYVAIERAYVSISPDPPGIDIGNVLTGKPGEDAQLDIGIHLRLTNVGNTPAIVTNALMHLFVSDEPLPELPPYNEGLLRPLWVTVMKGQEITLFQNTTFSVVALEAIRKGESKFQIYAVGYVDYIDKFKARHRFGYGRIYKPSEDNFWLYMGKGEDAMTAGRKAFAERINLAFVTQPNYSYDRERKKGEGDDWDDPPKQIDPNHTGLSRKV
jgi:hypothetical protein